LLRKCEERKRTLLRWGMRGMGSALRCAEKMRGGKAHFATLGNAGDGERTPLRYVRSE